MYEQLRLSTTCECYRQVAESISVYYHHTCAHMITCIILLFFNWWLTEVVSLLKVVEVASKEVLSVVVPELTQLLHTLQPTLHHTHKLLTHHFWKAHYGVVAQRCTATHVFAVVESRVKLFERELKCLNHLLPVLLVEEHVTGLKQVSLQRRENRWGKRT